MTLRTIPPSFDADVVAAIDARLAAVADAHGVSLPLAVESGSRAWGFPSPDSDYDCRFVYVRRRDDYLTPWPPRDVIETPLDGLLDVNGWDLGKALQLMVRGNAVIVEWLQSPIVYQGADWFRAGFRDLARRRADRALIGQHYLHVGERHAALHLRDTGAVPLKRLFYILRPAAALRWLRRNPPDRLPPMHFPTVMAECEPPPEVAAIVAELVARKATIRELGAGPVAPALTDFIFTEFATARAEPMKPATDRAAAEAEAADFFRSVLRQTG